MSSKKSRRDAAILRRLRETRERQGLTQAQLAEAIGVTTAQVSNVEAGSRLPSLELAVAIADYLNVSVDYLLDRQRASGVRNAIVERLVRVAERLTEQEVNALVRMADELVKLREQRR